MTHAERKALEPFFREVASGPVRSTALQATAFLKRFAQARRPLQGRDLAKVAIRLSKKLARAEVRAKCVLRAGGLCECCGVAFDEGITGKAEMDHFYGRAHAESVAECWMLRAACHLAKTRNHPTREEWDRRFQAHCWRHNLPFRKRFFKQLARRPQASEPDERMERSRGGLAGISTGGNRG